MLLFKVVLRSKIESEWYGALKGVLRQHEDGLGIHLLNKCCSIIAQYGRYVRGHLQDFFDLVCGELLAGVKNPDTGALSLHDCNRCHAGLC